MLSQVIGITAPIAHKVLLGHPVVARASLSIPDTLFLFVVALVVFGPKRLPEIGKQIGKLVAEFRRASNDFKFQIEEELRVSEQHERMKTLENQAAAKPPADNSIEAPRPVDALPAETLGSPEPPDRREAQQPNPRLMIQQPSTGLPVGALPPNHTALNAAVPQAGAPPQAEVAEPVAQTHETLNGD